MEFASNAPSSFHEFHCHVPISIFCSAGIQCGADFGCRVRIDYAAVRLFAIRQLATVFSTSVREDDGTRFAGVGRVGLCAYRL